MRENRQFLPKVQRDLFQDKTLPDFFQPSPAAHSDLIEDPVGEPLKGEDVHVHEPSSRVAQDHFLLRLHRELLRHEHDELRGRLKDRSPDDLHLQKAALSGSAAPEIKMNTHTHHSPVHSFTRSLLQAIAKVCASWKLYEHSNGFRARNF